MSGKGSNFLVLTFCAFLGIMMLGILFLPKQEFSPVENRYLTEMPEFCAEDVMDGSYMKELETYVSDHVPLRDFWVQMHATLELFSGKKENSGVYFSKKDTLLNRVDEPKADRIDKNMNYINTFANECDVPIFFGLIPTAAQIWADRLPHNAPTADESEWIQYCYEEAKVNTIDIYGALSEHAEEDVFYRTDHHWTSLGAYYGANEIFRTMGYEELSADAYTPVAVSEDFQGTLWSASGAWWTRPDTIQTWIPEGDISMTSWFTTTPEEGSLYVEEYLSEKDKYSYFLGGNQPLCVLKTPASGEKILVIRDSYSDSLAPFLTERFSEIHFIDLRYNRMSVLDYVEENEIDCVLILYGFSGFAEERNLVFLGR